MLSKCVDACGFARSNITTNDRNSKSVAWHSDHWVVLNGQVRTHMWVVVVAVAVLILVSRGCAKCSDNVILVHMSQCTQKMGHMLTANSANSKDNYTYLNSCCPTALIVVNYYCYFISRYSLARWQLSGKLPQTGAFLCKTELKLSWPDAESKQSNTISVFSLFLKPVAAVGMLIELSYYVSSMRCVSCVYLWQ